MDQEPVTNEISSAFTIQTQEPVVDDVHPKWITSSVLPEELSNGSHGVETTVALHCPDDSEGVITEDDHLALSNDGMSEFSNSDISLPEVCISSNNKSLEEEMNYEVQQAYRIFSEFLSEKHKVITSPFLHPIGNQETQYGIGGVRSRAQAHLRQSMCLHRMEEKFINQEYETITEFVADFRLMLENCYRYHGVDHWLSKQAQKLEIMLEQKLTLLSRTLREKTTLGVTSKGRFGVEEERVSTISTRRRQAPRSLKTMTVGGHESVMVQTLRVEEQQRAKEEKRQRELEKKEAEEMSAKEMDEWEQNLLSQASPHTVETLWELPAIGHFLCLAQTALNLPEIIFFELERCLLMPRCSILLSKIMSSLLCPPQRRSTLHRRPVLPYRRWEFELRQQVKGWYQSVSASHDQAARAEQLGLCHQFFSVLGEVSPLEAKAFHMLPFYQRVWLLKGLCDNVYETQKDVQDSVLAQPIHECRESILGYDSKENAYIHFPHFCGADLRIYWQSPCTPPTFPFPSVLVKKEKVLHKLEEEGSHIVKDTCEGCGTKQCDESASSFDFKSLQAEMYDTCKRETTDGVDDERCCMWKRKTKEQIYLRSTDEEKSKVEPNVHTNAFSAPITGPIRKCFLKHKLKEETAEFKSKRFKIKEEMGISLGSVNRNEMVIHEPCLSVGEHCYTGRSPACSVTVSPLQKLRIKTEGTTQGDQKPSCLDSCKNKIHNVRSERCQCCCGSSGVVTHLSSENAYSPGERVNDKIWTKKKKRKKKRGKEQLQQMKREHKQLQPTDRRLSRAKATKPSVQKSSTAIKRKDKNKKHKEGKKVDLSKKIKYEPQAEPSFKLVCTNLDDLRELINKTEDELDDLESTKKRLSRWYYRREAVKDLHSTLIRLLNELSPWEPKLIKAYQRNRLRLKKEFEVFRNHPEYNNFVREECISSSSSSDDEEGGELDFLSEQCRQSRQEDPEHVVPRGLWIGAVKELAPALVGERPVISHNHQKQSLSFTGDSLDHTDTLNKTCKSELNHQSLKPSDSNSSQAPCVPLHTVPSSKPTFLHTASGQPKCYTPIPTLLAKSVGNKVTLMKQPNYPEINSVNGESKSPVVSNEDVPVVAATKLSKTKRSSSGPPQISQQKHDQNSHQIQTLEQPVMDTLVSALSQSKTPEALPKNTIQVLYKVHKELNHLVGSSNTNPRSEEIRQQQVVILPPNLVRKTDEKVTLLQQQSKSILEPNTKMDTPICMSTNVPGFTIPENRILVQQVAPLKDAGKTATSLAASNISSYPWSQQSAINTARPRGTLPCDVQTSNLQCVLNNSPIAPASSGLSKATDSKQELKTVCIRESQSILVTTRGGNTGIVKVQKASDHTGSLSNSPVITFSPQFQAFLISKTSPPISSTSQNTTSTATSRSTVQTQVQIPSLLKSPATASISMSQHVSQSSSTLCQGVKCSAGYTSTTNNGQPILTAGSPALLKNTLSSLSNFVTASSPTGTELISKPHLNQTNRDDRSQVAKFILVSPTSSSPYNVNVSCKKTLPTSVMLISQPTAKSSLMPLQGSNTVLNQATTTGACRQQQMTTPSSQKMVGHTITTVNSVSLPKNKDVPVSSGTSTVTTIQFPESIGTIRQSTAVQPQTSSKSRDTKQMISTSVAQIPVTNSNVISSCTSLSAPASSLTSLKHLGISSVTMISQPGTFTTCPSTKFFSVVNSKKNHGLSNIMFSSKSDVHTATSQSIPNPISAPSMNHQALNNLFISDTSGCIDKTFLSPQLSFTKSQNSSMMMKSTEVTGNTKGLSSTTTTNTFTTSTTGTIQQRILINTSTPLAGGTHIVLNNAHFVVPPQGLGPGSHVLVISSHAPQQVPGTNATTIGATAPQYQGVNHVTVPPQAPVLLQSSTRLPSVPAIRSPFVACTPAVAPPVQANSPSVTAARLTGSNSTLLTNKTNAVATLPSLKTANIEKPAEGASIVSVLQRVDSVLTSTSTVGSFIRSESLTTTTATLASSFSNLSTPPLSNTVLHRPSTVALLSPVKADPVPLSTASPYSQGLLSPTYSVPGLSGTTLAPELPSQHPTIRISSISSSPSTALLHLGLSNTSVQKQPVPTGARTNSALPTPAVPPVVIQVSGMRTLPCPPSGSTVKSGESKPPSRNTAHDTVAQSDTTPNTTATTHHPDIVTNPAMEKHFLQTSALGMHSTVASKLLISPDGAVLSTLQCKVKSTLPETPAGFLISPISSTGALHTQDFSKPLSQMDTKSDN